LLGARIKRLDRRRASAELGADLTPTLLVPFIQQCITKTLDFGFWTLAFLEHGLDTQGHLGNRYRTRFRNSAYLAFIALDLS
jgi:hypothetical protein